MGILNQYPVIYIDFSEIPEDCVSYREYINRVLEGLKQDLSEAFPEIRYGYGGYPYGIY